MWHKFAICLCIKLSIDTGRLARENGDLFKQDWIERGLLVKTLCTLRSACLLCRECAFVCNRDCAACTRLMSILCLCEVYMTKRETRRPSFLFYIYCLEILVQNLFCRRILETFSERDEWSLVMENLPPQWHSVVGGCQDDAVQLVLCFGGCWSVICWLLCVV